jgi:hypothetical protein|tara:strand:+ start:544 stop:807 length:264 start_codon:yes stop_codon:yes gene_type:complete
MPIGYRKEYEIEPVKPDNTPIHRYTVDLSERDVDSLKRLAGRNGAGMTAAVMVENIAIWKMINQVCESPQKSIWLKVPEIEHPEWLV